MSTLELFVSLLGIAVLVTIFVGGVAMGYAHIVCRFEEENARIDAILADFDKEDAEWKEFINDHPW